MTGPTVKRIECTVVLTAALILMAVLLIASTANAQTCPVGWTDTSVGSMAFCNHPDHGSRTASKARELADLDEAIADFQEKLDEYDEATAEYQSGLQQQHRRNRQVTTAALHRGNCAASAAEQSLSGYGCSDQGRAHDATPKKEDHADVEGIGCYYSRVVEGTQTAWLWKPGAC